MKIKNQKEWQNWIDKNKDPYGSCVIRYAEKWADMMEVEMEKGKELESIAKDTGYKANKDFGITGFMYGAAVSVLCTVWEHGEELRQWHNLDTQIKDEGEKANEGGGVLNPALMSVGK
jgi:hypothetical protein